MAEDCLKWAGEGRLFDEIVANVQHQIDGTTAYIMVDDLNHLVKGGRLSNGAANDSPEGITKSLSSMLMSLKKPKRFVRCWWLKEWKEKFLLLPLEA